MRAGACAGRGSGSSNTRGSCRRRRRPAKGEGRWRRRHASRHRHRIGTDDGAAAALQTAMSKDNSEINQRFIAFYRRHRAFVMRVVAMKCPQDEIGDVAMRVWGRIHMKWPFPEIDNIEVYLTRAAQNEVKMFLRERDAQKRPSPKRARPLPDERPSGANLHDAFVTDPDLTGQILEEPRRGPPHARRRARWRHSRAHGALPRAAVGRERRRLQTARA